ncbi:Metallo-dependent phosphatase [Pseudovirgaria hyperparasitica]|uniref:Metallo-dependent phosphatase n=1 Tax=Pseudovirgaria hyperparasitica TaxID=470096 RepID=A0A6A6W383_9PEZI|nr:Metallo-dependent phosphatase [Pseudovirgaria hyperparasitica]KAF2756390.1 Metallo-dependent phosphatase [Pseudovirgaria hyperparasitica]
MTRRLVRTGIQLLVFASVFIFVLLFIDRRYTVLPASIHSHLPAHHPGLVITDITVESCSGLNLISSCRLDPDRWHRIEKDLYLKKGWLPTKAFVHIRRSREEDLTEDDKVVIDVKVGRTNPTLGDKEESSAQWELRPGQIWLKRSVKKHESDSKRAVTAVDVLFGTDAVEPRPGWEIKDIPIAMDGITAGLEPKLSIRRGKPHKMEPAQPRIRKDGKFKILQVSDLHLSTGVGACREPEPAGYHGGKCEADPRTLEFVGKMLDDEKPDMVVFSGDQVNGDTAPDSQTAIFKFAELVIKRQIPYATIYGNHDDEGSLNRASMMALTETLPYSVSEAGPSDIDGVGNYYVEVLVHGSGRHSALTLYFVDSHGYSPDERNFEGYDWIKPNQISWFKDTATALSKSETHTHYTHIHLDMAFIHIPLPEYIDPENEVVGMVREGVTAPAFNSHFKNALVEQGISVLSCGHDHANEYCAISHDQERNPQLWMCYAGGSGFGGYGGYDGYIRRVRVFEIDTADARITTWKRVEYPTGSEERIDEQTIVNAGKAVHQ